VICPECKEDYPAHLVQEINVNGIYKHVCGICALEVIRNVHHQPDYEFRPFTTACHIYEQCLTVRQKRKEGAK
jgi:hypothetical protein